MSELIFISVSLSLILIILYLLSVIIYSLIAGAPYAAVGSKRLVTMIDLLNIKKGSKIADLGSGDGRIVIACAKKGAKSFGYEINPLLILVSRLNIKKSRVANALIYQKSYWHEDLSSYNAVTLYGTWHIMSSLEKKLRKELKSGSRVVSNHFKFPNWKEEKSKNDVHLYIV